MARKMEGFSTIKPEDVSNAFEMIGEQWFLITAGTKDDWNTMTAAWGGFGILWHRKVMYIFIRPSRHTHNFTEREDKFTCAFFDKAKYKDTLMVCGTKSGRDIDKATETGLTPMEIEPGVVGFEEADTIVVCNKIYGHAVDPKLFIDPSIDKEYSDGSYHTLYVGEIEQVLKK